MNIKINLYSLTLVLFFSFAGHSQTKPPEQSPQPVSQWSAKDTALSLRLRQDGMKYETAHAVLWVEKDGLSRGELEEFGNLVNQGIINIEKFLGAAYNKKRFETDKIEYFLSSEDSPSHTTSMGKPAVFLRLDMVKARRAPYLHETGHLLTSRVEKPQWLEEGFASYLETVVSARYGGYNSYLFNWDKKNIFEFAREELSIEAGKKVLPLVRFSRDGLRAPNRWRFLIYFAGLGLGFIMIEIALLGRFTLFLGQPVYTFAVVLASLLVFTGVGAYLAGLFRAQPLRALLRIIPLILITLIATAFIMPLLFSAALGFTLPLRVALAGALLAPLGILLGMPFPTGLRIVSDEASSLVPWSWGVNGFFTVIGTVTALILGMAFGFKIVLLVGALCYLIALVAIAASKRTLDPTH